MKNSYRIAVFILFLLVVKTQAQTIRIADNNPTRPAGANIFATIQAAVNAASPGDLVYVQPSTTSYGDVIIDRPVTLRGIGFNSGKDIALQSTVGFVTLTNTISNATNASGSTIEGLNITGISLGTQTGTLPYTLQNITITNNGIGWVGRTSSGYVPAQSITIQNNAIFGITFVDSNLSQLLIYGNVITGQLAFGSTCGSPYGNCANGGGALSNTIISNNIITQSTSNQFFNTSISNLSITNNLFIGGTDINGSRFMSGRMTDTNVSNNIFYGTNPGSNGSPFERNSFLNNLTFGTSNDAVPPAGTGVGNTGSGNLISVDPKFVNAPFGVVYANTMNFTLQSGSPAKNAGTDGTDIGITGGAYPATGGNYLLTTPHAPVILTLNPAAIVPQGQPILTNVKAKSN
jgi:hypothetical protein